MKEIKDRIAHVMKLKDITATQLADDMNVQRSGISHILSGRNNPSLDFITKLKETYSEFNLDWLLLGHGPVTLSNSQLKKPQQVDLFEMNAPPASVLTDKMTQNSDFDREEMDGVNDKGGSLGGNLDVDHSELIEENTIPNKKASLPKEARHLQNLDSKKIIRMLFIYEDKTFSVFDSSDD